MNIVSVNRSSGRTVSWKGRDIPSGIFKDPVPGPVWIRRLNLEGDRQSDLTVHGGTDKAVYSYDLEDYDFWTKELHRELPPGMFGENLTTRGLLDRDVCVGDVLSVGKAVLQATQPRLPCYKISMKFEDDQMVKRFTQAARWGIYFRVLEEGVVESDAAVEFVDRDARQVTIDALARLAVGQPADPDLVRRALEIPSLTAGWRDMLEERAGDHR